ncbi:MAG: hypothetical protein ABL860_07160 [Candidatus Nitrotoga sp.]
MAATSACRVILQGNIVSYIVQFIQIANSININTSAAILNSCYASGDNLEQVDKSATRVAVGVYQLSSATVWI